MEKRKVEKEPTKEYTPEDISNIVFWSFFISRGEETFHHEISRLLPSRFPEMIEGINKWADKSGFRERTMDEWSDTEKAVHEQEIKEMGSYVRSEDYFSVLYGLDRDKMRKNKTYKELLQRVHLYTRGPNHIADPVPTKSDSIDQVMIQLDTLFRSARGYDEAVDRKMLSSRIGDFAKECIELDWKSRFKEGRLGHLMFVRFALSKNREQERKFLPKELQILLEEAGEWVRENYKELHNKGDVDYILRAWEGKTGEEITI